MNAKQLLQDLTSRTMSHIARVQKLQAIDHVSLNRKTDEKSWSILECIEHLNRYGDYYIPEITTRIKASKKAWEKDFKSGWLGNYFAESMLPKEQLKKMKTFKSMNPVGSSLNPKVINTFLNQQSQILELLKLAEGVSLSKTKTSISISSLIKLKLGDTLRFVIFHNERHLVQAERLLN